MSNKNIKSGSTALDEFKFTWTIKDARNIFDIKTGNCIYSPSIKDGNNSKWVIRLYPNGLNTKYKDYISIFIGLREKIDSIYSSEEVTANISFVKKVRKTSSLLSKSLVFEMTPSTDHGSVDYSNEAYISKGICDFLEKDVLKNHFDELLSENGDLKIYCKIVKENNNFDLKNSHEAKKSSVNEEIGCLQYCDFEKVLNNEVFSDIKLVVGNVTFSAHKVILAAKSPVFMAITEKGPKVQTIEINDIKESVVKEMLRYMYIGRIENIEDCGVDLLAAASKYQIESLMKLCQDNLMRNLVSENAIEILLAAESLEAENLKNKALLLISANIKDMMKFEDWSKLNLKLVTEILHLIVNQ